MVERRSPKPDVEGSSPSGREFKKRKYKMATLEKNSSNKNFKENAITYFKGVKNEWSKVSWPTKKQVVAETVIVLIVVVFFTLVVYFMDIIFKVLLNFIQGKFGV